MSIEFVSFVLFISVIITIFLTLSILGAIDILQGADAKEATNRILKNHYCRREKPFRAIKSICFISFLKIFNIKAYR